MKKWVIVGLSLFMGVFLGFAVPAGADEGEDFYNRGLELYEKRDNSGAYKQFIDGAAKGHAGSQYYAGLICEEEEKYNQAAQWYTKAANQGLPEAQFKLGKCYFEGMGVPVDKAASKKWLLKATDKGSIEAQKFLSENKKALSGTALPGSSIGSGVPTSSSANTSADPFTGGFVNYGGASSGAGRTSASPATKSSIYSPSGYSIYGNPLTGTDKSKSSTK